MKNIITILLLVLSITAFAQKQYPPAISREEELDNKYASGLFRTQDASFFDFESDNSTLTANSFLNVLDWLQGRVAGLQVYNYRNIRIPIIRNQPAAIFVNEMRVDAGFLNMLPVADIAMVKVIKTPFFGSWGAGGGAIAVYTKRGEEGEDEEE